MKAPITPTQAWAVIAESAGWNAKELPVLPDPYGIGAYPYPDTFTRAQTFTYGQQCAAQARKLALEEAAHIAHNCIDPAPIIRNLMKKGEVK